MRSLVEIRALLTFLVYMYYLPTRLDDCFQAFVAPQPFVHHGQPKETRMDSPLTPLDSSLAKNSIV
jgi:hypothetical protein